MAVVFEEPLGGARQADGHELDTSQYRGNPEPFPSGQGDENLRVVLAKQAAEAADRKRLRDLKAQPAAPHAETEAVPDQGFILADLIGSGADQDTQTGSETGAAPNEEFDLADLVGDDIAQDLQIAFVDAMALRKAKGPIRDLARQSNAAGFKKLRRESMDRRKSGKRTFGPFLKVREGNAVEGRNDVIVIQDGRKPVSTGIAPIPGVAEEDHEGALEALADHIGRSVSREQVKADPNTISLEKLFRAYLPTLKPTKGQGAYDRLMDSYRRKENANWWLIEFGKGKTLRYVDDDFGRRYKKWRLGQKARRNRKDERKDSAIEKEQYLARDCFSALTKKLRKEGVPAPDLSFAHQKAPKRQKKALTWMEFEWLLLGCLGFQREGNSYKKKTEIRHGVEREVWDLADSSQTRFLIRFFFVYFFTGTRFDRGSVLLWGANDGHGWLDPDGKAIWRNGRREEINNNKVAGRSLLSKVFAAMVRKWFRRDQAKSKTWGFAPVYVLHDADGNPLKSIVSLVREVFKRAGLEKSSHILKHTCITLHGLAGATSDELSEQTNTTKKTIEDTYEWVPWFDNRFERRKGVAEITRLIDIKKASPIPILPEIAAMANARLNGTA